MMPDDFFGPTQWDKLVDFCRERGQGDFVHPHIDPLPELNTRDLEEYDVPYGGKYVRKQARLEMRNTVYVPKAGDQVFIQVQPSEGELYNAKGIPEPAIVLYADEGNHQIEVFFQSFEKTLLQLLKI